MNSITAKVINKSGTIEIKSAKALIKELFKIMPDIIEFYYVRALFTSTVFGILKVF